MAVVTLTSQNVVRNYARLGLNKQRLGELIDLIGTIGFGDTENRSRGVLPTTCRSLRSSKSVSATPRNKLDAVLGVLSSRCDERLQIHA